VRAVSEQADEGARTAAEEEARRTLVSALEVTVSAHQLGRLEEAEAGYRAILQQFPDQADALNFLGVVAHQRGRTREGIAHIERSIVMHPDHATAHMNLGTLLAAAGETQDAIRAYRRACALEPDEVGGFLNLGYLLDENARFHEAVEAFEQVLGLEPDHVDARRRLAEALYHCNRGADAAAAARAWLEREPDNPVAAHLLAAYSQENVPPRASDACMRAVFGESADSFDERLGKVEYVAPGLVAQALHEHVGSARRDLEVLDAGCGTGLCGPILRAYAARLTGIDLSPAMLAKVRERDIYDELIEGEITEFLATGEARYDLIACVDTLIYFGALGEPLERFGANMTPGAHLIFTLEALEGHAETGDVRLTGSGRYAHTLAHVRAALGGATLELVSSSKAVLRLELGREVDGHIVVARKAA
jgi:predicted TPR repeat methyltransferase